MRQITLDTETTGLAYSDGHRIIEIGCIELIDRRVTGQRFHVYLNPDRAVDLDAFNVHGLSDAFLQDKPRFAEISQAFIEFIEGAELLIHNAPFDVGFVNHELSQLGLQKELQTICEITDTLLLARQKHPGQKNSLDALCKRYEIDNRHRQLHGALLDAEILANVYLAMTRSQETLLPTLDDTLETTISTTTQETIHQTLPIQRANAEELRAHQAYCAFLSQNVDECIDW